MLTEFDMDKEALIIGAVLALFYFVLLGGITGQDTRDDAYSECRPWTHLRNMSFQFA